jgi:hypothetical protein
MSRRFDPQVLMALRQRLLQDRALPDAQHAMALSQTLEGVLMALEVLALSIEVEARDMVRIKVGSASMDLRKSGDITIDAKDFNVKASGRANVKASGETTIVGRKIMNN